MNHSSTKSFAIVSLNITRFRYVIETHGYAMGDKILKEVAELFIEHLSKDTLSARCSADRFVLLLPYVDIEKIRFELNKLYDNLEYITIDNVIIKLGFNTGVYIIDDHDLVNSMDDICAFLEKAELARMKINGDTRNQIMFFEESMHINFLNEKFIEESLDNALTSCEFLVYYQPKFDLVENKVIGAEALVRWNSKKLGMIFPNEFIPLLEQNNNIIELDFYVLREVCRFIRESLDEGLEAVPISINQSRNHMLSPDYFERINSILTQYNIPKELIEFEITERVFLDLGNAEKFMNEMHKLGYMVSMDDFGSGYSSLNLLNQVNFTTIKLDRCFLSDKGDDEKSKVILSSIVQMAKFLDMSVICEGVESMKQEELLKSIGCYYVQGYRYAKPMPEQEFVHKYMNHIKYEKQRV